MAKKKNDEAAVPRARSVGPNPQPSGMNPVEWQTYAIRHRFDKKFVRASVNDIKSYKIRWWILHFKPGINVSDRRTLSLKLAKFEREHEDEVNGFLKQVMDQNPGAIAHTVTSQLEKEGTLLFSEKPRETSPLSPERPRETSPHLPDRPRETSPHSPNKPRETSPHSPNKPRETSPHIPDRPRETSPHSPNKPRETSPPPDRPKETSPHIPDRPSLPVGNIFTGSIRSGSSYSSDSNQSHPLYPTPRASSPGNERLPSEKGQIINNVRSQSDNPYIHARKPPLNSRTQSDLLPGSYSKHPQFGLTKPPFHGSGSKNIDSDASGQPQHRTESGSSHRSSDSNRSSSRNARPLINQNDLFSDSNAPGEQQPQQHRTASGSSHRSSDSNRSGSRNGSRNASPLINQNDLFVSSDASGEQQPQQHRTASGSSHRSGASNRSGSEHGRPLIDQNSLFSHSNAPDQPQQHRTESGSSHRSGSEHGRPLIEEGVLFRDSSSGKGVVEEELDNNNSNNNSNNDSNNGNNGDNGDDGDKDEFTIIGTEQASVRLFRNEELETFWKNNLKAIWKLFYGHMSTQIQVGKPAARKKPSGDPDPDPSEDDEDDEDVSEKSKKRDEEEDDEDMVWRTQRERFSYFMNHFGSDHFSMDVVKELIRHITPHISVSSWFFDNDKIPRSFCNHDVQFDDNFNLLEKGDKNWKKSKDGRGLPEKLVKSFLLYSKIRDLKRRNTKKSGPLISLTKLISKNFKIIEDRYSKPGQNPFVLLAGGYMTDYRINRKKFKLNAELQNWLTSDSRKIQVRRKLVDRGRDQEPQRTANYLIQFF